MSVPPFRPVPELMPAAAAREYLRSLRPPRSLARDIDVTRARLAETLAAHDSRAMPEDVWTALADAHHYLTAADAYLRRAQRTTARVEADDE